jgi:hypothetical protein
MSIHTHGFQDCGWAWKYIHGSRLSNVNVQQIKDKYGCYLSHLELKMLTCKYSWGLGGSLTCSVVKY